MFSYNILEQENDLLLAVCDADILGKTFGSDDIEITVSDFYKGRECNDKEILRLARKATIINAIGNNIVDLLIKNRLVEVSNVLKIGNVMHAQVVSVE